MFLVAVVLISIPLNDRPECLSWWLHSLCWCEFSVALSADRCYEPVHSCQVTAHVTFSYALIISSLLSVPELFIVKIDVVEEAKKEPPHTIKAAYVFISPVTLDIASTICWCVLKTNFLKNTLLFLPCQIEAGAVICIVPDCQWGPTSFFHAGALLVWILYIIGF